MSMLNIDGQLVASQISNMYTCDVFVDILRSRRAMKAEAMQQQQQLADQQHYAWLVAKYNNLADRFNDVLAENERVDAAYGAALAEKDRQIARLTADNAQLAGEKEETRKSAYEGWTKHGDALIEIERLKIKAGESQPPELKPIIDF